ncbi:putative Thiamin/hydroxymethyl pyrimidine-binding protein [Pseudocohnilembus persalinus]|uniref:Putative Thiamin/hydroxymethyl pyrimidine-binding protein n=1 Tax=Pseudocohnilembus persalinus TaxID=266149 RepID=A0A0V0Q866_PSEPJ|nr:putative Thiamin/hydroxymethyl pyrimidine-binding protein [Pseudocohnilembus persalinus]|eukprot:KRW98434.1 putative Thiamin/hydroxymethyl pyrimidine-binding protein [Pseudocohnilembus persalinus]
MHTQKCIVDLSVTPMGKSSSVSEEMVQIQKIIKKSGLSHQMHAEGTNIEGDWDTVFTVIRECHEKLHEKGIARISSNIRISTRTDKQQTIQGKLDRVNKQL